MQIIPGILATSTHEFKQALKKLSFAKKIHVDIMDGKFVPNKTIQIEDLKKMLKLTNTHQLQIHLMANKPETYVDQFTKIGAKEFIFHTEATTKINETIKKIQKNKMKA